MGAAAGAAAAEAARAKAIKASGTIVRVEPSQFEAILAKQPDLLVVTAEGGVFSTNYQYLTSYKGLAFFCKSDAPLKLPETIEVIAAEKIWIPD
jgi:ABC-type hemin transport system substrate-binding protein